MNRIPCTYAIIQFLPFVETGEFANFGVVLYSAAGNRFGYRLAKRRTRIVRFFDKLDQRVFVTAKRELLEELNRLEQLLKSDTLYGFDDSGKKPFQPELALAELIRHRETIVRFSPPRAVLATDFQETLSELFEHYVEHGFATPQYQEQLLERGVRKVLKDASLSKRFRADTIGDDVYHVRFPFVDSEGHQPISVIKPIDLQQPEATKVLEHGGSWLFRIDQLRKRQLMPRRALFVIGGRTDDPELKPAQDEILDALRDREVELVDRDDAGEIVRFAMNLERR